MNKTSKKVILSVCLAVLFLCIAVVSGVLLALNANKSSKLAPTLASTDPESLTTPSKMKLTSDVSSITPGGTFTIHVTFTTRDSRGWNSLQALIVPVDENGDPNFDLLQYFTLQSSKKPNKFSETFDDYTANITAKFNHDTYGDMNTGLLFSMFSDGNDQPTSEDCEFEAVIAVSDEFPIGDDLVINLNNKCPTNQVVTTASGSDKLTDRGEGLFSANDLKFGTRNANTEAEIESIKFTVDVADDTEDFVIAAEGETADYNFDSSNSCEITLPETDDLDLLVFYPVMKENSEGATVNAAGTTAPDAVPAAFVTLTAEGDDVTVSGTNRYLYIQVTSEDGNTTNVYTVKLTFTYARLSNLTATSSGFDNPAVTKYDLDLKDTDGVFDPDTFAYTACVPEGTTSTAVTPTLAVDYGTSTVITVVKNGNYTILSGTTINDQGTIYVQNISDGETLSLKITAQDGTTTQTYEITFQIVTTDTSIKDIVVKGSPSDIEIPNNEAMAEQEDKDYYFFVGEGEDGATADIQPTDPNATIEIRKHGEDEEWREYDPEEVLEPGEYDIKITASAGNSEEYTMVVDEFDGFKLDESSEFDLIALVSISDSGYGDLYRRTYEELEWTHGVDDRQVERYVLGEIPAVTTTLTVLVANFSSEQLSKIKVYNTESTLVYDGATGGIVSGHASDLVCTSWKIVYGEGAAADVIYVSVLGDTDCDGYITTADAAEINSYVIGRQPFDDLEVRLAAYMENDGYITTTDAADVNTVVLGVNGASIENFFRKNQA